VTGEVLSLHALNSKSPGTIRLGASGSQPEGRSQAEVNGNARKPSAAVLEQLFGALDQVTAASHPRTFKLLQSGRRKLARKLIEEACEVTVESVKRDADGSVRESADLLYHLVVLWFYRRWEAAPVPGKSDFRVQRQNGHNVRRGRVRESRDQVDRAGRRQYVGIWGRPGKSPPCGD
jgi:phosphoribosyl-ATP pyrophosphohydrolase